MQRQYFKVEGGRKGKLRGEGGEGKFRGREGEEKFKGGGRGKGNFNLHFVWFGLVVSIKQIKESGNLTKVKPQH